MSGVLRVGVLGASGFAGAELMRLLGGHPSFELVFAAARSQAGTLVAELYPNLAGRYPGLRLSAVDDLPADLDVVFSALPHGVSQALIGDMSARLVVDLASDFRFDDPDVYPAWYGSAHQVPERLGDFAFGLVELFREELASAKAVAVPGCYVTAAALTMAPLISSGVAAATGIVVDAASGVSGAGRDPKPGTTFAAMSENFTAYGLLDHRHTPEIEMALGRHGGTDVQVLFTPHLLPASRGILATCYLRPTGEETSDELLDVMATMYKAEPFIHVTEDVPATKSTLGSNSVHVTVRRDQRTGWIVAIGALDNLVKGAAGHAIQGANVALGLEETAGLPIAGMYP